MEHLQSLITNLLSENKTDRKLRAYAYLTASFKEQGAVNDPLDCLLPFVIAGLEPQKGKKLDLHRLSDSVSEIGLNIPIYVLEQLNRRLVEKNHVEWNKVSREFIVTNTEKIPEKEKIRIVDTSFEKIEEGFSLFAREHGIYSPPNSSTWSDALISFLKSETTADHKKVVDIKGTLVGDTARIENYITALFIQKSESENGELFNSILNVFTGVIIEDFIDNIQLISSPENFSKLNVYYDTTVLLRLLGTSGKLWRSATMEMHRTLQDLGCKAYYFDFIEAETQSVLDALVSAYNSGQSIFNETSEALYSGEITISEIKDMCSTLPVRLGHLNVFPFEYKFSSRKNEDAFQIDENDFSSVLIQAAKLKDRTYKQQNAIVDAKSIAIILRLRRGVSKRDVSESGHLFISRNSLLQRVSRNFCSEHVEGYNKYSIPPVLTVSQVSTVAWLSSAHQLEPKKVSKELLANCYNAVRPSAGWADEFSQALLNFQKDTPELAEESANQHFFLQTARLMARDESLGQTEVLKKIPLVDIFQSSARQAEQYELIQKQRIVELEERVKQLEAQVSLSSASADISSIKK